jgi:hypothetical protein
MHRPRHHNLRALPNLGFSGTSSRSDDPEGAGAFRPLNEHTTKWGFSPGPLPSLVCVMCMLFSNYLREVS